jgi:hypothetical protein
MLILLAKQRLIFLTKNLSIVTLLFAASFNTYSQTIPLSVKNLYISSYKQAIEEVTNKKTEVDFPFVIGKLHYPVVSDFDHPYYKENKWSKGSLLYNGILYDVDVLKYDIESDKIIYLKYTPDNKVYHVALDENFIHQFSLSNITFRYFKELKNRRGGSLKNGYYEVTYDGIVKFLVQWKKAMVLDLGSRTMNYKTTTTMFLLKNGQATRVKSMAKLIHLLKDKKTEVKKFVRSNYLKLNGTDYSSAFNVLKFYESL